MARIHNTRPRMPAILTPDQYDGWLDGSNSNTGALKAILAPFPDEEMTANPISNLVNSVRNDGAHLLEPVGLGHAART